MAVPEPPDGSPQEPSSSPVFISHSSRDADFAGLITRALEAAGVRCWLAPRDIPPSANWNSAIMAGINDSRALVLVLSRHSMDSDPVMREVERAVARRIPVLPVRLAVVAPSAAMEYLISTFQWVDAFPPPVDRHLDAVAAAVKRLLKLAHEAPARDPNAQPKYVGPYRILEPLGEGGMGTVYKAEQQTPLKRTVAIKLIKLGLSTNEVLARFETERQALARMDNPHIARVLDAGVDDVGRPYFVMEYVPGLPITRFADDNALSIAQRLDLFIQVCGAIAHAHTKALIHRDVKAANVLAYMADGKPTAKVIDFGVAKALTGDRLTDRTFNTERGLAIGSYEAMSPEQADGSPDIDTRTDVYSLGVLLYELLAGAKPFDPQTLLKCADAEVRRIIKEVEPPRPSSRLTDLGEAASKVASARRSHPSALASQLRSELEWIPLMAMRKERQRRYASPLEMAEDIQNYLHNRPLKAGPESVGYRLWKGIRRNRAAIVVASAFVALITFGTALYIRGIRAEQGKTEGALREVTEQKGQTEAALARVREQKKKADDALDEVQKQKKKTEEALADAKRAMEAEVLQNEKATAVNNLLLGVVSSADSDDTLTVVQAIEDAARELDKGKLTNQPHVEAGLRLTIGQTLRKLGRYGAAEPNLLRAVALYRELPGGAAYVIRGLPGGTTPSGATRESNEMTFGKYELANALDGLALLRAGQKRYDEAEALAREALGFAKRGLYGAQNKARCARTIGSILQAQGKLPEAEAAYREAIELASQLFPNLMVDIVHLMNDVGYVLQIQKKLPQAEAMYRDALALARRAAEAEKNGFFDEVVDSTSALDRSLKDLAAVLWRQDKPADGEPVSRELLKLRRATLPAGHADIARAVWGLSVMLEKQGKDAEAKPLQYEALKLGRKALPPGDPDLVLVLNNIGAQSFNAGNLDEAAALFGELLAMLRKVRKPDDPELLRITSTLAFVYTRQGKSSDAEPLWRESVQTGKAILPANNPQLATFRIQLARALRAQEKHAEAVPILREILQAQIDAPDTDPGETSDTSNSLANALDALGKLDEAETTMRQSVERGRKAWPQGDPKLATELDNLGLLLQRRGRLQEAEKVHTEAIEMYKKYLPEDHPDIAIAIHNLAGLRAAQKRFADAYILMKESMRIARKSLPVENARRTGILIDVAAVLEFQDKADDGEKVLREELDLAKEKLGVKAPPTARLARALADMLDRKAQKEKAAKVRSNHGLPPK
jgi:eukaryotic-like serine/threonine-protein kinase